MINNNFDVEKSDSHSSSATTTPDSTTATESAANTLQLATTTITATTINSNSIKIISINDDSVTPKITTPKKSAATTATPPPISSNDNNYFNRFDNRIAANLAAVINGSRFRSSSCSKSSPRPSRHSNATEIARKASKTLHCNGVATIGCVATRSRRQHSVGVEGRGGAGGGGGDGGGGDNTTRTTGCMERQRPSPHFFSTQSNLNCNDNELVMHTTSCDADNSPTELNNCKRSTDKPPLVKRITMGLLRSNEDLRPLVPNFAPTSHTSSHTPKAARNITSSDAVYSNGYAAEDTGEPAKFIASKFGDSCRQSLTAIPMLDTLNLNDNSEFNLKKRYLRETSSANSSPKMFAHRLRLNGSITRTHPVAGSFTCSTSTTSTTTDSSATASCHHSSSDSEEAELKDAPWFQAGISSDIADEVLDSKSPGAFLVRRSTAEPGCYALTLRMPSPPGPKVASYIILATPRGYKIKGFRKEFSSLKALITHHSVMPEMLPVPLAMPRPTNMTSSRRNLDDFDTYDSLQMLLKYLRAKNMECE